MKKAVSILAVICILLSLVSCGTTETANEGIQITDSLGNTAVLNENSKVAALYASFADCWLLSGGKLAGVTDDAVSEHGLEIGDAQIVGTVKSIDLEKVVSLSPDYVIMSADLTAHTALKNSLDDMRIPYGYFRVDTFEDYKEMMEQFCSVNNRPDLFNKNVTQVEEKITKIKSNFPRTDATVLLIRAYSTGMKAKRDDNLAGYILSEFGLTNIADTNESLLEDLSLEEIVKADPDYIFAMTMGNEESAQAYLEENAINHPAWRDLKAVKNGNYYMLPKQLFHYKPNDRWGESYEYLAKIIRPEIFEGQH